MLKLLILDVDGVMTDGTKTYGPNGEVLSKRFADHDFTGIKKFIEHGVKVCFLSADKCVNEAVAKDRGIDFHYSRDPDGTIDKVKWLGKLLELYDAKLDETIYVGDDLFDLPIMDAIMNGGGYAYCPSNAVPQVISHLTRGRNYGESSPENKKAYTRRAMLTKGGGYGAVMELFCLHFNDSVPPCH